MRAMYLTHTDGSTFHVNPMALAMWQQAEPKVSAWAGSMVTIAPHTQPDRVRESVDQIDWMLTEATSDNGRRPSDPLFGCPVIVFDCPAHLRAPSKSPRPEP